MQRDVLRDVGVFDVQIKLYEDFDLCLRLARERIFAYCPEPLSDYRAHGSGAHNLDYKAHMLNISKLHIHTNALLTEHPQKDRDRLIAIFLNRADDLILQRASRRGELTVAVHHYLRLLVRSPGHIPRKDLYLWVARGINIKFAGVIDGATRTRTPSHT